MNPMDSAQFPSSETYISGMTALLIPDEGRYGGDWHFIATLCRVNARVQSAGAAGNLVNTNPFFGSRMIVDKAEILKRRSVDLGTALKVFCASHPRAIADLLYHSFTKDVYPAHVVLEGGIFEEDIEFAILDELMELLIPFLDERQRKNLARWKNEYFIPARDGVSA